MSNLLVDIKALLARRQDLVSQLELVDAQLADVRKALGVNDDHEPERPVVSRQRRRPYLPNARGWTQQRILDVLAQREPLTTAELKAAIPEVTSVGYTASLMWSTNQLVRRKSGISKLYSYARSDTAFETFDRELREAAEAEAAAEPG